MMATHPSTPERSPAEAEARQIGPPGEGATGRDAWLAAIDGLLFGDDPSQGVVRGTLFIHPKLGFAFEAPSGFTLKNQSAALIGVGEGGAEALRLDSIPISDRLPSPARSRPAGSTTSRRPMSRPCRSAVWTAAEATARGDQWSFRLGAVRLKAASTVSSSPRGRCRRPSISVFAPPSNRSTDQRARSALAAPQAIKIVAAGGVDTADTFAARMAFLPEALDQFLILNGLERGAPLVAGRRYKIGNWIDVRNLRRRSPPPFGACGGGDPQFRQAAGDPRAARAARRRGDRRSGTASRRAGGDRRDVSRQRRDQGRGCGARLGQAGARRQFGALRRGARRRARHLFGPLVGGSKDFAAAMARVERECLAKGAERPWRAC